MHTAPLQLSVPGAYRLNVQVPGARWFTWRLGPEPSLSWPTFQVLPVSFGAPAMSRAFARRATSAAVTSPFAA